MAHDEEYAAFLARQGVTVIDAYPPGFFARLRMLKFSQIIALLVFFGTIVPFGILFVGIVALGVWDHMSALYEQGLTHHVMTYKSGSD